MIDGTTRHCPWWPQSPLHTPHYPLMKAGLTPYHFTASSHQPMVINLFHHEASSSYRIGRSFAIVFLIFRTSCDVDFVSFRFVSVSLCSGIRAFHAGTCDIFFGFSFHRR